ncbi:MAG: hypothetical protein HQK51_21565, partial [Oligoflexia bacterium]|nr:hypothetical protein [Oligoflexia bacterium]
MTPRFNHNTFTFNFIENKKEKMLKSFKNKRLVVLGLSYLFGYTKGLNKEIKKNHKKLALNHLFTPSGIHLSSLLLMLVPGFFVLSQIIKKLKNPEVKNSLRKKTLFIIYLLVF